MTATQTSPSGNTEAHRPQFTAVLLLKQTARLSFAQIHLELKRIAPQAAFGDWSGPVTDPAVDPGIEMLSLNGERMSVLVIDGPAPASMLQAGPFANPLWPNAEREAVEHKAHILVICPEDPVDREAALAKARAATLLAGAIARLVPALGVIWVDGANVVKADKFISMTDKIGQPGANAVPFWVRLMLAKGPAASRGGQTLTGGTFGLRIFGLRELEYAPAALEPGFIMQHAYSVSEYLLRSGKRLDDGETIGVDGEARFAITFADKGGFGPFPIARLSLFPPSAAKTR
jgi:hypothetical protein